MMNTGSLRLIYFSPTNTTKKILEGIAQGFQAATVKHVDLTPPDAPAREIMEVHNGLAVIGSPVYIGRLPDDTILRLQRVKGNGTPAVIVVLYGNREYDDAMLELRDLAVKAGFRPVAAGAFIGEHSLSTSAMPIAAGRPDEEDLKKAREFGKMIREKIKDMRTPDDMPLIEVPGSFPYREPPSMPKVSPVTQETVCIKCGKCASVCPTAAITIGETVATDQGMCIRCCACVKNCPAGARKMEDSRILQKAEQLFTNCRKRKEPETYL
ncbi:MAG TPA: 4Fe-4S binding protein [Syntrophorhabdaceae bacterium]|nr:4Fe-4S binding protein [Syntrophorhabdaceae bacterium]HQM81114.1 4Fe-4S binding protein [Syntrophorhabdaceae bacterium]